MKAARQMTQPLLKRSFPTALFVVFILVTGAYGHAADSTDARSHPNNKPYKSSRTFGQHVLALPSYLFHWATRPLGWGVMWAERELPELLQGERAPYGIFPLVEIGGSAGTAYGILLYHNQLPAPGHKARIEVLFNSQDYNDFDASYEIPGFIAGKGLLRLQGEYENDPIEYLYLNQPGVSQKESIYATEEISAAISYTQALNDRLQWTFRGAYQNVDVSFSNRDDDDDEYAAFPSTLLGKSTISTVGSKLLLDLAENHKRIFSGSRYILEVNWNRSMVDDEFHFMDYSAEWQQFVPVPWLPQSRRLAFRSRIQKAVPLGEKEVPFWASPSLGGSNDLRGFRIDRFREDGSLLLTLEYRYPLWDFADAVLFVDKGQVFDGYSDIAIDEWRNSYGLGVHFLSAKGFAFRGELAFSREYVRGILSINPNF